MTREAVVDPAAADKVQAQLHDALAPSAREKLARAGAKVEVKAARTAVTKAFPDAQLDADTVDALAFYVMSESMEKIAAETRKIVEQRNALKAAGVKTDPSAKFALRLSNDYATAPEPLAADAKPEELAQRMAQLGAMHDLNERAMKTLNDRRMSLLKAGHDIALNSIRNMK